ncbi:manganese catalase family protein [Longicatena caecimuris]|uniref:Spore coat protein JC n=2 Tax=Longicatena caecimuris TaxID=1796635 RepID=A0A4R3TM88_9FIRM|nr:manganese catalase family protein [Longicatena caecimuris]MCR1869561.1 manganese catalase family protein [Longicatena caecimuris]MCU0102180.1 manganese catalase family protein [Longicatena caecimuris]TCU62434.1 spore coat protein JC [Longicatena caecimuris]
MWVYEKKLQFPVQIEHPDPSFAKIVITQIGGPDGELSASMRYLNQRYAMPYDRVKAMLTDIGTEELAHLEMVSAIVYQLTRNLSVDEIKKAGFDAYYVDHTTGIWPQAASGAPFTSTYFQSKGDPITDLMEDMAADGAALYDQH